MTDILILDDIARPVFGEPEQTSKRKWIYCRTGAENAAAAAVKKVHARLQKNFPNEPVRIVLVGLQNPRLQHLLAAQGLPSADEWLPLPDEDLHEMLSRYGLKVPSTKANNASPSTAVTCQLLDERTFSTNRGSKARSDEPTFTLRLLEIDDNTAERANGDHRFPPLPHPSPPQSDRGRLILELFTTSDEHPAPYALRLRVGHPAEATLAERVRQAFADYQKQALKAGLVPSLACLDANHAVFTLALPVEAPEQASARQKALDDIADSLLNDLLLGARPVPLWRTSFLVALEDEGNKIYQRCQALYRKGELTLPEAANDYGGETATYFLPEIRGLLMPEAASNASPPADSPGDALWSFKRHYDQPCKAPRLRVHIGNYDSPLEQPIREIRAHFGPAGIFWLEWVVEEGCPKSRPEPRDGERREKDPCLEGAAAPLWRHYLNRAKTDENAWSFAQVLDFNAEARLLLHEYPRTSFGNDGVDRLTRLELRANGETTTVTYEAGRDRRDDIPSLLVMKMLALLLGEGGEAPTPKPRQLTDHRARVITSLILDGGLPQNKMADNAFDALLARLSMVDPYGTGWPYDEAFCRATDFEPAAYKRFWSWGARYMITDHSFVFLGFRWHPDISYQIPSFAEHPIHTVHMRRPYARLYRFFLAIEASLRLLALRLAELQEKLPPGRCPPPESDWNALRELRHGLDRLSARFINAHVSSQVQGRELAQIMRRQFDHAQTWRELQERVEREEGRWRMVRESRHRVRMNLLYFIGTLLAAITGVYALRPDVKVLPGQAGADPLGFIWGALQRLATAEPLNTWCGQYAITASFFLTVLSVWWLVIVGARAWGWWRAGGRLFCLKKLRVGWWGVSVLLTLAALAWLIWAYAILLG